MLSMAKVIQPLGSAQASGHLDGYLYRTVRGASVVQPTCARTPRMSERSTYAQSILTLLSREWAQLTDAERDFWRSVATPGSTGLAHYCKCNWWWAFANFGWRVSPAEYVPTTKRFSLSSVDFEPYYAQFVWDSTGSGFSDVFSVVFAAKGFNDYPRPAKKYFRYATLGEHLSTDPHIFVEISSPDVYWFWLRLIDARCGTLLWQDFIWGNCS